MGKVDEAINAVKAFTVDPAKNYMPNQKTVEMTVSAVTGKYCKRLEGGLTLAQVSKVTLQLDKVVSEYNGQCKELFGRVNKPSGRVVGALKGVASLIYKSPDSAALTVVSQAHKKLTDLLALSKKKQVEAESQKKAIEKMHVTFKAEDVSKVLNLPKEVLKANTLTFFSDTSLLKLVVSGDKTKDMNALLGGLYSISNQEIAVDIHDLEDQLTKLDVALPEKLESFTQLLHFATKEANDVCQDALKKHFEAASVVPSTASFSKVSYGYQNNSVAAQAKAKVTFASQLGDAPFATGEVVMTTVFAGGPSTTTYTVRIVTVNANADMIDLKKFAGAFSSSSGVGKVESA